MSEFKQYRRKQIAELRPYEPDGDMVNADGELLVELNGARATESSWIVVSISAEDQKAGSPKAGDMIARNPKNHADQWLVAAQYFADNFEDAGAPERVITPLSIENLKSWGREP